MDMGNVIPVPADRWRAAIARSERRDAEGRPLLTDRQERHLRRLREMRPDADAAAVAAAMGEGVSGRAALEAHGVIGPDADAVLGAARMLPTDADGRAVVHLSDCDECDDGAIMGHQVVGGVRYRVSTPCGCRALARAARATTAAGLPYALACDVARTAWRAGHPEDGPTHAELRANAREEVRRWIGDVVGGRGDTLALVGPAGTGKSRLLVDAGMQLARALAQGDREPVAYFSVPALAAAIAAKSDEGRAARKRLEGAAVVLADEWAEDGANWAMAEIRLALMQRYNMGRATLIASNHLPNVDDQGKPARGRWGYVSGCSALISRCEVVDLAGPDWRKLLRAEGAGR